MLTITHSAMGSPWEVQILDDISNVAFFEKEVARILDDFDHTYSRFIPTSLISELSRKKGKQKVPRDIVAMLREYMKMSTLTGGKINPLVGGTIEDLGYDADYSLVRKETVREVPSLEESITIEDDTTLIFHELCLIDFGAMGKGYSVGLLADFLHSQGIKNFLINGSGDLLHNGSQPVTVGLENPFNTREAIGTIKLSNMALASSGSNRRAWGDVHHIIDPVTKTSPQDIVATWVLMENPALADLLATTIFLVSPESLKSTYDFEWLIVSSDHVSSYSKGFIADLF